MSNRDNTYDVPEAVQMRVLGFNPTDETWIRIVTDPVVSERRQVVTNARRALLGPLANNIYAPQFKSIPMRTEDAHKNLSNIVCDDAACTFAIVGKMSVEERVALRDRALDEKLHEGLYKASHAAPFDKHGISLFYKMSAEQQLAAARVQI